MQRFLSIMRSNWITAVGAVITTVSFMAFVTTLVYLTLHGEAHGAYLGIFAFLALPALFLVGIVLMPIGLLVYRSSFATRMAALAQRPMRILPVLGVLTLANFATVGTAGYEAVQYMDTKEFCGKVCHTVMSHSYDTARDSPHAGVACVACHIGPGVQSFMKAKMSGLRQVTSLLFDTYQRPIPTPVHSMRSAHEICEECHWPGRISPDRLIVRDHFADDAAVTQTTNVVLMKIGGVHRDGSVSGIHWHAQATTNVTYATTDPRRLQIGWIRKVDADGKEHIFTVDGENLDQPPKGEVRRMDCMDCHNQPAHRQQEPDAAIDEAIAAHKISRELPSIRKLALASLHKSWQRATARDDIRRDLQQAYADGTLPADKAPLLAAAADAVADIWLRNVQPEMKVTWGTYPVFMSHGGCLRCHDGQHLDSEGEAISADCALCHSVLADKAADPEILKHLQIGDR